MRTGAYEARQGQEKATFTCIFMLLWRRLIVLRATSKEGPRQPPCPSLYSASIP